jgi:crotonobetainyl-CoA:carnitine CoA-transferase CaiB-like acyl-CoA transferase
VIKVERAEGDFARGYDTLAKGQSSYFVWLNRGKESLVADLKNAEDAVLLKRIIARADVFIQNLAPGAAARAGFGSAELRAHHPRLITLDISGYGESGEYARMKAYDLLVQAESGLTSVTGRPEGPGRVGVSVCDIACGMSAHAAILEALIERGTTGRGKGLAVSLFDGMADWMTVPLLFFEANGKPPPRIGLAHPSICPYGAFATADGSEVLISIQNEREWADFCARFLGEPDLPKQPSFATNLSRVANRAKVDAYIGAAFAKLTRSDAAARLRAANTAYGFVNAVADLARHPALRRAEVMTPAGPVELVAAPAITSGSARPFRAVPAIGEHSGSIRAEFAG